MANGSLMSCKDNGHHDSTTCDGSNCIRLFGVQIDVNAGDNNDKGKKKVEEKKFDGESLFIRKCKSLGNLAVFNAECPPVEDDGYLSDGPLHQYSRSKQAHERKRGKPWSEEEHRAFLVGLEKLGKGDWKGIAKQYVPSRNSSQVASHAQKYFIRLSATEKKRRRSSVFDIPLKEKNEQASLDSTTNKTVETSQPTEVHHPAVTPTDKPPRSPIHKQSGITNFRRVQPYMGGVSCMNPGSLFIDHKTAPTVSWLPVVSYPNQNHVFLPTVGRNFATCSPFVPQASGPILQAQIHQAKSPQAPSTGVTESNVLLNLLSMEKLEM